MSAWPQAVWIVRKLQQYIDYDKTSNDYIIQLVQTRSDINSCNSSVNNLKNTSVTLVRDGIPDDDNSSYSKYSICFLTEEGSTNE